MKQSASWITVGFVVFPTNDNVASDWIFARKYDPQTEEVSSIPMDSQTEQNLLLTIQEGRMEPQRAIPYDRIITSAEKQAWQNQTCFMTRRLLQIRGLPSGSKIVPGSYMPEGDNGQSNENKEVPKITDGVSVLYPPIPFLETSSHTLHRTRHTGTKKYLAKLSPSERTALFVASEDLPFHILQDVLTRYYNKRWQDLLGDMQLSYTLFLHLHCLSSLEHWRDLISMISLVSFQSAQQYTDLFAGVLKVLFYQLASMEQDFFEDVEYSGDNFLFPAIRRLCSTCAKSKDESIQSSLQSLILALKTRFPAVLCNESGQSTDMSNSGAEAMDWGKNEETTDEKPPGIAKDQIGSSHLNFESDDDDDDDDGPVVISSDEVEASLARSSDYAVAKSEYPQQHQQTYPLLFASLMPKEDILMACARILDEARDVSLVREAAAYLEEVESKNL
eukprot:CAMPEP_0195289732 /NCGR_PEP_ID=MMETSP0707-20130614/5884_1 /TAXON_ID=33640 /ORGANISM="Asterionellopsis glacialis, Strain CCMP134" /LENGTH=446 /DNA_ID=CAMNT_0040349765 /DNA_START=260 /DNA_END=1600 /DNA_ORIENTATION=+